MIPQSCPRAIAAFSGKTVVEVACGTNHIVDSSGFVYTPTKKLFCSYRGSTDMSYQTYQLIVKSVLIFVTLNAIRREAVKMVCIWVGGENESSKSVDAVWQQVTGDFLHRKGISDALPIKINAMKRTKT